MDEYVLYCLADRFFYDTPTNRDAKHPDFDLCTRPLPVGWEREATEVWMNYAPTEVSVPNQGWKIHVSACLADVDRTLQVVWDYCVERGVPFKFLRNEPVVVMYNSKSADREASGKLVTIYPADDAQLELVLKELNHLLAGVRGPYVLSDLRYAEGPLYVRYGGFAERHCLSDSGQRVLAVEDPGGRLVPDNRRPVFAPPEWVPLPSFLEPHLAARNAVTTTELRYLIEGVIQFSNGGGVYLGRHKESDRRVVLKEGRPHAGLDVHNRDAVARIGHEQAILERLAGIAEVPAVLDSFTLGEHHFLVEEFVDANPLQRLIVNDFPLTRPDPVPADLAAYAAWARSVLDRVEVAVAALHGRGVVFCDLHPDNVLIGAEDRLVLIDFEVATAVEEQARSALAHPGYSAPPDRQGVAVDAYALACMRIGIFAPETTMLLPFHPGKVAQLADLIAETFPVPRPWLEQAVRTIVGPAAEEPEDSEPWPPLPGRGSWPEVREALSRAIVGSATPDRDDRLFPGDIAQFTPGGGLGFAHGAAGVLYALHHTGAGRFPEYETWLRRRALGPIKGTGFYDGRAGVAYVLDDLGHRQDALDAIELSLTEPLDGLEFGLRSGLAGIGLNLLHFWHRTGETSFLANATRVIDFVADRLGGPDDVPEISGEGNPRAGLLHGSSGAALLFLHGFERSGDAGLLELAEIALRQDLRRCVLDDYGTRQVSQGWRTLPYLEEGSVGIAVVLRRFLRHRPDPELAEALASLQRVTRSEYFVQPGLFAGRAGLIMAAADERPGRPDEITERLIRGLAWHAVPHRGGLAFPGDRLLRLSMDLATGSAGVLLALGAALHDRPVQLPFFGPAPGTRTDET